MNLRRLGISATLIALMQAPGADSSTRALVADRSTQAPTVSGPAEAPAAGGPAPTESRSSVPAEPRRPIGPAYFAPVLTPAPGQTQVHVPAFRLDPRPVTNQQFLDFVRSHPLWRRDRAAALFADDGYLSHWAAPDALGQQVRADQPVTRVSWFAARAYCTAAGGRLPAWNEWELAAAADEHVADARADALWRGRILNWYARPATDPLQPVGLNQPNMYGIQDLHGLIWEWVDDYASLMVSSDSRNQGDPDKLEFCGAGSISAQDRENYPVLMRVAFLSALEGRSTARRLGFRCAANPVAPEAHTLSASDEVPHVAPASATATDTAVAQLPGNSLYQLPVLLDAADGKSIPLSSLRSKPLLITMFYGNCNSVCPIVTHQLQDLERRLTPRGRANTRILMVSFDSANDTPAALSAFAQHHHISGSDGAGVSAAQGSAGGSAARGGASGSAASARAHWIFARASADDVRLLAATLGIRYRQLPDGSFNHSTAIVLADRDGVIRSRTSGLQSTDAELVTMANSMSAGIAASRQGGASERHR